jgi:hypothetical protein
LHSWYKSVNRASLRLEWSVFPVIHIAIQNH